ncbi:hypothetical protein HO133_002234 [Letharia lupina]|uniref:Uncharacterized protein n=1 Tax=Letharia lupina TaxID=560253 RepID=A0A8H6CDS3_9LECA|nr:uncharacterized protein HO133_002234 [Letharia lupina]KAF6221379.1 hypothetical protein HO133_002234 [Letharia lupina]
MSLAYLPLPKLTRCNRSILPSDYSKQGDTPSARLSKLGCGPYRRQKHTSGWTPANKIPDVEPFDYRKDSRKPKYIEKGDPLQDEEILLQGLPIVEPGDEAINTIRKVPSDQALMPLRWGSSRRATGRSKSGLQIQVPSSNAPTSLILGEAITGKSIIYAYTSSSSSSSGRTTSSFGAVGDHLASTRSAVLPRTLAAMGDQNPSVKVERSVMSANCRTRSPLADLVLSSTPDEEPYQLLALGQVGPWKRPFTPQLVKPSRLCTLIQRRRSLSDLKEAPQARQCSVGVELEAPKPQVPANMKVLGPDDIKVVRKDSLVQPDEVSSIEAKEPPVWSRKGLPFEENRRARSGLRVHLRSQLLLHVDIHQLTEWQSKVFIMKSTNIHNLRASVEHEVWSSTKGANRVLQNAWESRKPGEKIIFMFSITHRYGGKYCGLAEMSGPFDPEREVNIWTEGLQGNEGVIPTRWIVAKDVEFSAFDDLNYNDKRVTQLRHAESRGVPYKIVRVQRAPARVIFVSYGLFPLQDGSMVPHPTMNPPSRGLETVLPTQSNAASPTMLTGQAMQEEALQPLEGIRSEDALGQFSYAPATQTTVVTTTTTTTTNFPPIMMKAPQHLYDLDPKLYPLASSPTPTSIKKLCFDVDGTPTLFQEADDTLETLEKLKHQQKALTASDGALRSVAKSDHAFERPRPEELRMGSSDALSHQQASSTAPSSRRKRSASPVSISEAVTLASGQVPRKRRLVSGGNTSSSLGNADFSTRKASQSRLQIVQTSTPITPHLGRSNTVQNQTPPVWLSEAMEEHEREDPVSSTFDASAANEDDPQILSPRSETTRGVTSREDGVANHENDMIEDSEVQSAWRDLGIGSAMTPRMENDEDEVFPQFRQPDRPRPTILDTTAAQDVSLPSPSLSPVTAAANMQSRRGYFEQPILGRTNAPGSFQSLLSQSQNSTRSSISDEALHICLNGETSEPASKEVAPANGQISTRSLLSLPSMVDTFEAMPEEMKSYLMYQFLRRCSKPVLHFVADVVNPALKCDFLRLLPVELCINVIGNLDVKTLCRAAQVSKRWRQLIDSSEKIWKRLFDVDNYVLPEGELPRAIREGWGWQSESQTEDHEKDLSAFSTNPSDTDLSVSSRMYREHSGTSPFAASQSGSATPQTKKSKRKAKSKSKPSSRKYQKRIHSASVDSIDLEDEALLDMASADGPYAAANAAAAAVPYPRIGLPSLKNLHLFKSIFMRHHIIRKTWMQDEVTPRHIAFRAHQRHVVTCLQFDADKILTGSDDSNINVYDTKTGALRATLEGHEGGVWALQYEGNVLVSGSTDRTVRVWDIEKGKCTQVFQGHTSTVRCLQILMPTPVEGKSRNQMMPKQPLIITGSRDSNLRVWKLPKPGDAPLFQTGPAPDENADCKYFVRTLSGHHHSVRAIAAYADTLVSGSYDCSVRVWKISTGETLHRLQGHTQKVYSVVLDNKRKRCISGSMDNLVKVWSLETGTVLFNLEGHSSLVGLLDLQQDRLVSAAADSTLRIWDPENGHCRSTLSAHTGAITCFQHDGQKVISGSDRTLKMWDVATGDFVKDLLTDLSGVWQVKFNERRCVAAVQRNNLTYIEVLDFGASRDGVPGHKRGRRIVVNVDGQEVSDPHDTSADADIIVED